MKKPVKNNKKKEKLTTLTPMEMRAYAREKLDQKYSKGTRMGNKTNDTGFGKTAPRKSGSGGASQKGGMYRKQTRPDFEYFQKEPAKQRQENTARRLKPKKK